MFIGRKWELESLNRLYTSDHFEFAVIYGRRRVGKSALINEFIKDKKTVYFMGVESNAFVSFQAALEYVFQLAEKERLILVIDEHPYVARSSKSLASTLQLLIDHYKDHFKLMLILCGSSMSYMEDHALAYKAPLYGRRMAQMKILPFEFEEACPLQCHHYRDSDRCVTDGGNFQQSRRRYKRLRYLFEKFDGFGVGSQRNTLW